MQSIPFLITIDTEGDNLWGNPKSVTTNNAAFIPRFQTLCEKHNFKPTYLTNYEMAMDERFVAFAGDAMARGMAEVGMHLHAWNSPPLSHEDDGQAYLIDYSTPVMQQKIRHVTELLEQKFGRKPTTHRAGRWAMDTRYAKALISNGYLVDCSVTPYVSWRAHAGAKHGKGGTDYRRFSSKPYFIDPNRLDQPGTSPLLELPMTIVPRLALCGMVTRLLPSQWFTVPLLARITQKVLVNDWFRPKRNNEATMLSLALRAQREGWPYLEFMLHSSELMPGGSPYFRTDADIERLYALLETVFSITAPFTTGMTLTEYYHHYRKSHAA